MTLNLRAIRFLSKYYIFIVAHAEIVRMRKIHVLAVYFLDFVAPLLVLGGYLGRVHQVVFLKRPIVGHRHNLIHLGGRKPLVELTFLGEPISPAEASSEVRFLRNLFLVTQVTNIGIIMLIEP